MNWRDFITACKEDVLAGRGVTPAGIEMLIDVPDGCVGHLAVSADEITRRFNGPRVDVEQLNNIKKNACSEDCTFCGQSAFFDTGIDTYRLPPADQIVDAAAAAKRQGAGSYCLVAAWREPPPGEFERVCGIISGINACVGIAVECSLGFLTAEQAGRLAALGVKRYNHNLETARSRFPDICTTHTYQDRLDTLRTARSAGLELCTGGSSASARRAPSGRNWCGSLRRCAPRRSRSTSWCRSPGPRSRCRRRCPATRSPGCSR